MEARKSIFIASSQEAKEKAERLVKVLSAKNLLPIPWWDSFGLGTYTFDQLNQHAQSVDGAIFIATKDDKIWYRNTESAAPRDNVILEFGLFAARLGLRRSLILAEAEVKLPSDLRGITYELFETEIEKIAEAVGTHFINEFKQDQWSSGSTSLKVICDPQLASYQISKELPPDWLMRAMYLGTEGARAWLRIAKDPYYQDDAGRTQLQQEIVELLKTSQSAFRTFVSLGPGDAELDKAVALNLLKREPTAQCIPVDLSDGLLWEASRILSSVIRVPVGLLADFEETLNFVVHRVWEHGKRPYLYGLLGNTFGNLDKSEYTFIDTFLNALQSGDELLLDVAALKDGVGQQSPIDPSAWGEGMKMFFAHGAARRLGISAHDVINRFESLISVKVKNTNKPIKGTVILTLYAKKIPFARVRRYELGELVSFFEGRGFQVRHARVPSDGPYDNGLLALRKQ